MKRKLLITLLSLILALCSFGLIACGEKGEPGAKGEQGVQGEQGLPGEPGTPGENGLSAYESYKAQYGYEGTEEEWLEDLVNGNLSPNGNYAIIYNNTLGAENANPITYNVADETITLKAIEKAGYEFSGWFDNNGLEVTEIATGTKGKITLNAKWETDIQYAYNGSGYTVVGIYSSKEHITILDEYNGLPVTSVDDDALYGCNTITSLTIGNNVQEIGNYAFGSCTSLVNVSVPNSVTSLGNSVFNNCTELLYNEYDNGCYLGNSDNPYLVLVKAKDKEITSCTIHDDTKFIHSYAFASCDALVSIIIPDRVISIGVLAFDSCDLLESVTFGESVKEIGESAFRFCIALSNITLGGNIVSVGRQSFYRCTALASVTIGENVTSIGVNAFTDCSALDDLVFEDGSSWYLILNGGGDGIRQLYDFSNPETAASLAGLFANPSLGGIDISLEKAVIS